MDPIFDYQFRLILIGDTTVGKSTLLRYFTDGKFSEVSDPTVGVDFFARLVQVRDGTKIKLQLWDTAGQERFRSITKSYYRNSVGAVVCYDITNRSSFDKVPTWMSEAKKQIEPLEPVILLVGCKGDLNEERQVPTEEAFSHATALGLHFLETSAKTGKNVEEAFQVVTQEIYNKVKAGDYNVDDEQWEGIKTGFANRSSQQNSSNIPEALPEKSKCC